MPIVASSGNATANGPASPRRHARAPRLAWAPAETRNAVFDQRRQANALGSKPASPTTESRIAIATATLRAELQDRHVVTRTRPRMKLIAAASATIASVTAESSGDSRADSTMSHAPTRTKAAGTIG